MKHELYSIVIRLFLPVFFVPIHKIGSMPLPFRRFFPLGHVCVFVQFIHSFIHSSAGAVILSILRKLANGACKYAEQLGLHAENEMMPILGMMAKITRHTAVLKRCHLFDVHIAAGGSFFWRTQPTSACYRFAHSMSRL